MNVQQAYRELGIDKGADSAQIKAAYRRLVLDLHPDRNSGRNDEQITRVNEAYAILKNVDNNNAHEQRKAQDVRNTSRPRRDAARHNDEKTPEQDWSKYTAEFEENEAFWKEYERNFWADYEKRTSERAKRQQDQSRHTQQNPNPQNDRRAKPRSDVPLRFAMRVDESLCIGCCSCETIAPKMFMVDKNTKVNPKSTVIDPHGAKRETLMDAAQTCPTKAIIVDDLFTRTRLYPI